MRDRSAVAAVVVLLLVGVAPACAVEIAIVPEPAPAPAAPACCCGKPRLNWLHSLSLPVCVCVGRECRKPCQPACMTHPGYYPTHWHYLPSDGGPPPPEPARAPGAKPADSGPELLPQPSTEPNNNRPRKGNGNAPGDGNERLPLPGNGNPNGMTYLPVYVVPIGQVVPASYPRR
jgi:hypothetical protein